MIAVAVKTRWEIGEVGKRVQSELQLACKVCREVKVLEPNADGAICSQGTRARLLGPWETNVVDDISDCPRTVSAAEIAENECE
jgi:hypothetical protein